MTVKRRVDSPYYAESEVKIDNFDNGCDVISALGVRKNYYLEKLRDIYTLDGAEVVFDTYPGLPPYIEIEGVSEEKVDAIATLIGLTKSNPRDRRAREMYFDLYGVTKDRVLTDLTFNTVMDSLVPLATHDKDAFVARAKIQARTANSLRRTA